MNSQLSTQNTFSTSDLALATILSLYYPIDSIDRTNPHKALFLFKREEELDGLVESYWRKQLQVEPQTYFNQLKVIKSRLYAND